MSIAYLNHLNFLKSLVVQNDFKTINNKYYVYQQKVYKNTFGLNTLYLKGDRHFVGNIRQVWCIDYLLHFAAFPQKFKQPLVGLCFKLLDCVEPEKVTTDDIYGCWMTNGLFEHNMNKTFLQYVSTPLCSKCYYRFLCYRML